MALESMEDLDNSSVSLSSLLCHENEEPSWVFLESSCGDDEISNHSEHNPCFVLDTDDFEYIERLVERETDFGCNGIYAISPDCSPINHGWLKCARLNAIEWILNVILLLFCSRLVYLFSSM